MSWQEQIELEKRQALAALARLLPRLSKRGVTHLRVSYDGEGDSGYFQDVTVEPESAGTILRKQENVIIAACEHYVPGGWEDNEGSFGTIIIDVKRKTISREHNWRVVTVSSSDDALDLKQFLQSPQT